ncbi:LysR family transcriptional regulator [Aureimonas altamirensis]|uniref:LysR family transcriptional regulator n=1 Tax=Aureimonas altamirensis TaxID=370622 RepID=UPI001E3BC5FC|nr:LysR family transcriptional regulator [Aureimonas altamirensis]UHD46361.1 LysR family transcriptional regulator [Aureimonas altamirensis]
MRSIELRHLRYFVATADHGSFRKAGDALGIQGSAVSRRVRDLEDHLGASLFHRYSGGVRLTFAGKRFLQRSRQIVCSVSEGIDDIATIGRGENGGVRIGIFSSIASGFLADLLHAYGLRHGKVSIELVDGNPEEHVAAIRQFHLDVAFLTGARDWPGCDSAQLWCERVFIALPHCHPLTLRDELTWRDLAEEPFIVSKTTPGQELHHHLMRELAALGRFPEIRLQSTGRDNLLPLVATGHGLMLISEAMTAAKHPGITYRPIAKEILSFSAVWSRHNDNPAFRRLLSMAKAVSGKATKMRRPEC